MKTTSKERIRLALDRTGKTLSDLARHLNRSQPSVSERLQGEGEIDSVSFLQGVSDITGYHFDWLRTGEGPEIKGNGQSVTVRYDDDLEADITPYLKGRNIRPIAVTVDRSGNELITYVPVKAQAGYRRGYHDPQFIQKLPAFSLPILISQTSTHRMFQVDGNSMRQLGGGGLNDGDVVIASYVEDIFSLKDGRVYVVVTTDGILIKRVINRLLTADKVLILNSDNKSGEYGPIIVHPNEILEVWEYKAHISRRLEFSVDLWEALNELQAKQAIMEDQLKQLRQEQQSKR